MTPQNRNLLIAAGVLAAATTGYVLWRRQRDAMRPPVFGVSPVPGDLRAELSAALAAIQSGTADAATLQALAVRLESAGFRPEATLLRNEAARIANERAAALRRQELLARATDRLAVLAVTPELVAVNELQVLAAELRAVGGGDAISRAVQLEAAAARLAASTATPAPQVIRRCKPAFTCKIFFDPLAARGNEATAPGLVLPPGSDLVVLEAITNPLDARAGWSRVRDLLGREGWIRTDLIEVSPNTPDATGPRLLPSFFTGTGATRFPRYAPIATPRGVVYAAPSLRARWR